MCLDLSKAFDSVDHSKLLRRIDLYGIRGNVKELIRSYLSCRTQQVVQSDQHGKNIISEKIMVSKGVPQGSILGPLLYILYTNKLPEISGEQTVLYADDAALVFSGDSSEEMTRGVHSALGVLDGYFRSSGLLLNLSKTQSVLFGNRLNNDFVCI